jgi:hypothetical protein
MSTAETTALSQQQQARAEALDVARRVLVEYQARGPLTVPSSGAPDCADLITVAHWIITGRDRFDRDGEVAS